MLFLMAAGLTLVFGIMNLVNLAHGALYMVGAYLAAWFYTTTGSFPIAVVLALVGTLLVGVVTEVVALRTLYERDHLDQVLATFGLILFFNQLLVVIVIGGIGSIRGALIGAVVVGMVDTLGRAFLKPALSVVLSPTAAQSAGPALASMLIYLLMAAVLSFRPQGLFPAARTR